MKKRITRYITLFLLLFVLGGTITAKECKAASADVTISAESNEITVGDNIFVSIKINSEALFGDFEANITYDEDILEYQGGASVITGGNGFLKISDMGVVDGDDSRKYTMKFKALKAGLCTLAFDQKDNVAVYDFDNGDQMSVSSNELSVKVKAVATASTNANLQSLKISPSELVPVFDKEVQEYNVTVGSDTEQLVIVALPEDEKSTVSISGNESLKEGENKVVVSVLAESGNVIEYTINVQKEATPITTTVPTIAPSITPEAAASEFEITTIDGEQYVIFNRKYKLLAPASDIDIPEGYKEGNMSIEGISVTVYLPEKNEESEFLLVYAMNELGDSGFYRYDRVEKTMLRYVPDSQLLSGKVTTTTENGSGNLQNKDIKMIAAFGIVILSFLSGFLAFIAIRVIMKGKKPKDDTKD